MPLCPTCGKKLDTDSGVSVHHAHVHGESISKEISVCESCGKEFEYYPSKGRTGSFCSIECNDKIPDTDRKLGIRYSSEEVSCDNCGEEIVVKNSELTKNNFCDRNCYAEWKTIHGESSSIYKGWYKIRNRALKRDEYICQVCGVDLRQCEDSTECHHCIPIRIFDDPNDAHYIENAIAICGSCHSKLEDRMRGIDNNKLSKRIK